MSDGDGDDEGEAREGPMAEGDISPPAGMS